jgi:hypothetical protein
MKKYCNCIFSRMLEKDPKDRFDINQVDEETKKIHSESKDIFEGNFIYN